jgi:uncharacterized protein YuzE
VVLTFALDGLTLISDYDEKADILYLWTEPGPRPTVTYEDDNGVLVQLDPETREFVGVTLIDYEAHWKQQPRIVFQVPEQRVLEPVG